MKKAILLVCSILIIASCTSVKELVDKGDYDGAILLAAKKIKGNENPKTKHVKGLEKAFQKVMTRDLEYVEHLMSKEDGNSLDRAYDIIHNVDRRQKLIRPFLPLVSKDGYVAHFKFVKTLPLIDELAIKATDAHYNYAQELLGSDPGDKSNARKAFYALERINKYFDSYQDSEQLLTEALRIGKDRIWITTRNLSDDFIPAGFEEQILAINLRDMNSLWKEYYIRPDNMDEMDYKAILELVDLDVSPEREKEKIYIDKKEIKDGHRYVLDENGNVAKDSLGNDIKEDNYVIVQAEVFELFREKAAFINASIKLIDLQREEVIMTKNIDAEAVFASYASRYSGDRRALCDKSRQRLRSRPEPFPPDHALLFQAADDVKQMMREILYRYSI